MCIFSFFCPTKPLLSPAWEHFPSHTAECLNRISTMASMSDETEHAATDPSTDPEPSPTARSNPSEIVELTSRIGTSPNIHKRIRRWKPLCAEIARRICIGVAKLTRQLWREVTDVEDPSWPPPWVHIVGILIAGVVSLYVVSLAMGGLLRVGTSRWSLIVKTPLKLYFMQHSAGLPVSPAELINAWAVVGIVLFIISSFLDSCARIGWVLFGLSSCAAVYAGTHPPIQWTSVGVAAFAWSGCCNHCFQDG